MFFSLLLLLLHFLPHQERSWAGADALPRDSRGERALWEPPRHRRTGCPTTLFFCQVAAPTLMLPPRLPLNRSGFPSPISPHASDAQVAPNHQFPDPNPLFCSPENPNPPFYMVEYDPFPKSQLVHTIAFRAICGSNLVTTPSDIRGSDTRELHRVVVELGSSSLWTFSTCDNWIKKRQESVGGSCIEGFIWGFRPIRVGQN